MTALRAPRRFAATIVLALVGCATPPTERAPAPPPPAAERPSAPVVREPLPAPALPPAAAQPSSELSFDATQVPAGTLYVCVSNPQGRRQQVAIAFEPKVEQLCRRHPEMGPCQYERNVCRRAGGRVYTASGGEITTATEAEYDRKVMRVRFRAD